MEVSVKTNLGASFSIGVDIWDTVLDIKKKIEKDRHIPVSQQTLSFQYKVLDDDLNIVLESGIGHQSRINLFIYSPPPPGDNQEQSPLPTAPIGDIHGEESSLTTQHIFNPQSNDTQAIKPSEPPKPDSVKPNRFDIRKWAMEAVEEEAKRIFKELAEREQLTKVQDSLVEAGGSNTENDHLTVLVLPHSGESKPAEMIWVTMKEKDKVRELRKELVKSEAKGELKLPQEGYNLMYKQKIMDEDKSFLETGVDVFDEIEIVPRSVASGSHS